MTNKQQPIAWAIMQPDSYRVFVLFDMAADFSKSCGGGEILPQIVRI